MEKDRNNMVSEPSIPVVACTEMTTSAAEEERCRELLAKLKDAIDKRGVMLDRLGKVMDEMVSSLASSTPLLVSSAADSTPNSTATNKVPAMTNAATSANATLTDQAHTKCSRLGLDTNADNLHVVAASNPETGVPTIASAPAEHSSAPSLKPFSTTQQDTLMPTMYSTICPDRSINVPTSVRATAVPPTSSSIIAALEIDNTLIDSTKLATAAASSTAVAFPQLITITEVIESSTRSTLAAFVSAHKLEVAATTSFITMCSTRQDDMCWLLRDDPSSEPDAVHLPVTILQSGLYICSLSCRAMQGHIRYHELPALGMCFVEPQQPWPPPTRVVCGMIMKFGLCKFNEKAIDRVVLNGVPLLILGLGKIEEFLGTVVRLQPWPPPAGPNCRDLLVKVDKVLGHMVDITLRWVVLQPPWPPPNLTAQIKMSYPAPLQIVEMKPWPPPRRGSCLLFSSITGTQDEFGAVLKHHLDNLLVVQNSSNQHEWRLPQLLLVYLVMVLNNCNASCRESNHGNFLQGNAVEVWEAHKVAVQTVLKLPSGELFTGSSDSTIKLWKGRTCLHIFSGHANTIRCVAQMPGYGAALTKVTINKEIPFELHQLAAVLLKQFIKQHWQEDEENFMPPIVSASEKVVIRQLLLTSLDDSHGKIHTAIGMAVAAIGQQDWPEDWPKLLPFLLKLIGDQSNGNGVHGALRCLALLSDDLDDTCIPKLVPELFPSLYRIMSSPHLFENSLRAKAIGIVHSCISMLGSMSGVYKRETVSLMTSMLDPLTEQFSIILNSLVQSQNPDDWSMQMEVLKCLLQLVQNFSRLPEAKLSAVLAPLWQTFVSSFNVYHLSTIQASEDVDSVGYDSDGSERSIESFGIQLFELWTTIVGNSRLAKVITGNIKELAYYTIAFQHITEEQVQNRLRDANQYVVDEDDGVAYSWNSKELKWDKIGEVVDGPGDAPQDKWLLKETLPSTYRQQVEVENIIQGYFHDEAKLDTVVYNTSIKSIMQQKRGGLLTSTKGAVTTVLGLEEGKDCIIVGTLYKHMKLKPSILDEYSKESGRVILAGAIPPAAYETGVVVALHGKETSAGNFLVEDVLEAGLPPQTALSSINEDKYVKAFVGGFPSKINYTPLLRFLQFYDLVVQDP